MLKIQGGDFHFWQWDVGRRLIVDDPGCSEVHFSNGTTEKAPIVDVRDEDGIRVAVVPALLLQTAKPLTAYAVAVGENGSITKVAVTFQVYDRLMPDDYVCSEDEIKRWSDLDERLSILEKGGITGGGEIDPESIKEAVDEYLESNPPAPGPQGPRGEQGPAGPQGPQGDPGPAGKDGEDYAITDADIQEIAAQAAGLVEVPEGGGGSKRIIANITVEENAGSIVISKDMDGKPFSLKECYVRAELVPFKVDDQTTPTNWAVRLAINTGHWSWANNIFEVAADANASYEIISNGSTLYYTAASGKKTLYGKMGRPNITALCFSTNATNIIVYAPGTKITVWGVDE